MSRSGHGLSNPSSSASFNFIYTRGGHVACESPSGSREASCAAGKSRLARGNAEIRAIAGSANQGFIEFQSRAIFIFEQSQVGCARSEPGPGSSSLCAIRATVVGTHSTPDWFDSSAAHLSSLSLALFPLPTHSLGLPLPRSPSGLRLTTLLSRAFRRKPTSCEDTYS